MVVHDVSGVLNGFDRLTLRDSCHDIRLYLVLNMWFSMVQTMYLDFSTVLLG